MLLLSYLTAPTTRLAASWTKPADTSDFEGFRLYYAGASKAPLSGGLLATVPTANTSWAFTDLVLRSTAIYIIGVPYNTAGKLLGWWDDSCFRISCEIQGRKKQ